MSQQEAIAAAKQAMAVADFTAALENFRRVDLRALETMRAVRALIAMGRCTTALGRTAESARYHAAALERLRDDGVLEPKALTAESAQLAMSLAVGAGDSAQAEMYMRMLRDDLPHYARHFKVSPLADARQWCAAHQIPATLLDTPQDITLPDGLTAGGKLNYRPDSTWHATIPNAEIVMGWDYVIAPTGEVLTGANYMPVQKSFTFMPHALSESANTVAHVWPAEVSRIEEDALFLSTPERHHYGHWLTEFLPRLRAWDRSERPRRKLVVSASLPSKHGELLARFGATEEDIVRCSVGSRYSFRSLRIVRMGRPDAPHPRDVQFLRAGLGPGSAASAGSRIFFMERDSGTRRPANAEEVNAVFKEFDVASINPARLGLAEQTAIFKQARAIVGAFGTELYCLFHMPPGSAVVELHWDAHPQTVFGPTARLIGLRHHLVICQKAADRGASSYKKDGDIVVDCRELRAVLTRIADG